MATGAPDFSYSRSRDGTDIAYMRLGTGPQLVMVPPIPLSNVSGDWSIPLMREVFARLASRFELILYDGRGTGASQRTVDDLSVEACAADLAAVVDAVGAHEVTLLAMYLACPTAVTFAARHPEHVSHLVLFGAAERGQESFDRPGTEALLSLIGKDWELFTRTAALDWMGWGVGEAGQLVADSFASATTPETAKSALLAYGSSDLRPLLGTLEAETLILHRRHGRQVPLERSADLAAAIPRGRLHVLEGASATLFFDDPDGTVDLITSFVQPGRANTSARAAPGSDVPLTVRETEVLRLVAAGESNAEIAHQLGLSVHTVERHAANIYRKIGARGRADATAWAIRHGIG